MNRSYRELYNIVYKTPKNFYKTYYQNETRGKKTRCIWGKEAAKAFADTVDVIHIFNGVGEYVTL